MRQMLAAAIDQFKLTPEPVSVVVVGGGSILMDTDIPGAKEVIIPPHYAVANAVGAASARVRM